MSRTRRVLSRLLLGARAIIATFWILGFGALPALATMYESIEVIVEPRPAMEGTPPEMRPGGYAEYRVTVRNYSKTVDHQVRLIHPSTTSPFYNDYLERNSRTVQVAHGSTLVVSLFQPSLPVFDEKMAIEIDGVLQKDAVEIASPFGRTFGAPAGTRPCLVVLSSRAIPQELKDDVRTAHPNEVAFCRSEMPTSEWSSNWLGYTAYDALLITEEEAAALPADVLLAIRRYAEAGGIVLIQATSSYRKKAVPEGLCEPDSAVDGEDAFHVGFGLVRPCPATTPWPAGFWTARFKQALAPTDRSVAIVGDVSVPVRGLLVVVIFFAIGIGPVNVWMLSRKQKRMWLWWNVPAVSFVTCLTVFIYSLFAEGISGHGRIALITLLDENTHRATSLGFASYYCPLTPSDGLHFSYDSEVVQLHANEARGIRFSGGRPKTIDWTRDQHLESGWVVARVPACFAIRKSETRRERLTVHREADGSVNVVNGLGVEIESLYYVDEKGVVGVASEVPAGQKRTLEPPKSTAGLPAGEPQSLRKVFDQSWNASIEELSSHPERFLSPGCYVALVKNSPFLEDPLVSAPQDGSVGVIYGIGARAGNGR